MAIHHSLPDTPELLLIADWNYGADRYWDTSGCDAAGGVGIGANHTATSYRRLPVVENACLPRIFPPRIGREENPEHMPLGMNRGRIDAKVKWHPWQKWDVMRWVSHCPACWNAF